MSRLWISWPHGEWRYYFSDHNGTPEVIVDARGQVLGRLKHTAYGRTTVLSGSTESTQLRFPGQYEVVVLPG